MKISVVIPLYNKEKHIQRAIKSVLSQTYPKFEMIVVDDGSTDGSFEAASVIQDPRMRIIRQENSGVSTARNRGVLEANSEWIAFLDADDEWLPTFLEETNVLIQAYPDCALIGSAYYFSETDGSLKVTRPSIQKSLAWEGKLDSYFASIQADPPFCSSSIVINKTALSAVGMYPEDIYISEDTTTYLRLSVNQKFAYIYLPLAIYHRESDNRAWFHFPEYELEVVKVGKELLSSGQLNENDNELLYAYLVRSELGRARALIYASKKKEAKEVLSFCKDSINYSPTVNKLLQWSSRPTWIYRKVFSVKSHLKKLLNRLDQLT